MKGKNLLILVVVAGVLVGLAVLTSRKQKRHAVVATEIGKPVLAALQDPDTLNSIERIEVLSPGGTVTVARVEGAWVAPRKYNYPADFGKVRDFVRTLRDLEIGHTLKGGAAERRELELLTPGGAATNGIGTVVKLETAAGEEVASLLVGKEHERAAPADSPYARYGAYPDGRYILAGEKPVLVADTLSALPSDVKDWFDTTVVNVSSYDITNITVTGANGTTLTFQRPEPGGDLVVADLNEDTEEMETAAAGGLANALSYLNFQDIADPSLSDEALGFDDPVKLIARTKENKVYTLTIGGSPEDSDNRYVRVSAAYEPPAEPAPAPGEDDVETPETEPGTNVTAAATADVEAEKAEDEARKKRREEQEKRAGEVEALNERVGPWTYVVNSYKVDDVTADRSAFVKAKEEEEEEEVEDEDAPPADTGTETADEPSEPISE